MWHNFQKGTLVKYNFNQMLTCYFAISTGSQWNVVSKKHNTVLALIFKCSNYPERQNIILSFSVIPVNVLNQVIF